MLLIDNDDVRALLTMEECIDAQERAFRKLETGGAIHRPRVDLYAPCEREDGYYRWSTMEGWTDDIQAIRMKSDVVHWQTGHNSGSIEKKYCVEPGTYCGLVFLFSSWNGQPLAMMNDGIVSHMRVAGGAGLGVKYLAREDAETVGILGSGGMARMHLWAFCTVRAIKRAKVYSPTEANRRRFAEEMSERHGIEVKAVSSAREAVRGADIVSTNTDSLKPVFDTDWLEPGMHLALGGPAEASNETIDRCDICIRQGVGGMPIEEGGRIMKERGQSPVAFVAGSPEQMKRLPPKTESRGFGGDYPSIGDCGPAARRAGPTTGRPRSTTTWATRVSSSPPSVAWSTTRP